jgi:prolyl 4-hydroxylase
LDAAELKHLADTAARGDAAAQERLADVLEQAELHEQAVHWLRQAAAQGHPRATARLGLREIAGSGLPADPAAGFARLAGLADRGDAEAAHLVALCHVAGLGTPRDLARGMARLAQAAERGQALAREVLGLLAGAGAPATWADWPALASGADLSWLERPFERRCACEAPRIETMPDFLPPWACRHVMRRAAPALARARVVDEAGGESVRGVRTNSVTSFGIANSDVLLELINLRIARAVGRPPEHAEGLGVLHYRPGETYLPHYDFIPETPENAPQLAVRGQRVHTLLVYLNDDFEGGETEFPRLGLRLRPPAGSAVSFPSITSDGRLDPRSLHAGLPPRRGEKWLISKWFRTRPLRPPAPAS